MTTILALFVWLPTQYASLALVPFAAGWVSAIPALGLLGLGLGVRAASRLQDKRFFWFAVPVVFCHALIGFSELFGGEVHYASHFFHFMRWGFIGVQAAIVTGLLIWLKEVRLAAAAISFFVLTYSLFAESIAEMFFTGQGL